MKAEKLMSSAVKSCSPEQSLAVAARLMWDGDCGCIPVADAEERVIGIITDRDICMAAYFRGAALNDIACRDAMSRDVLSCRPDDTIDAAAAVMKKAQVRRLPVTDSSGRLVGILSLNDIAREAARGDSSLSPEVGLDDVALTLSAVGKQHRAASPPVS